MILCRDTIARLPGRLDGWRALHTRQSTLLSARCWKEVPQSERAITKLALQGWMNEQLVFINKHRSQVDLLTIQRLCLQADICFGNGLIWQICKPCMFLNLTLDPSLVIHHMNHIKSIVETARHTLKSTGSSAPWAAKRPMVVILKLKRLSCESFLSNVLNKLITCNWLHEDALCATLNLSLRIMIHGSISCPTHLCTCLY